ncbi:MAG TPA: hypothetical protein VJT67_12475 [Longimicrobiaceae bacterium]|nr:hypothetical protein [Longimicrobiaceae bacterium]
MADSAVKIGLGALIGGLFGYHNAKLGYERDATKEYAKSRRDLLSQAVQQLNGFSQCHAAYWAQLYTILDKRRDNEPVTDAELGSLRSAEDVLQEAFKDFANIESHFLLAHEEGLYNEFRSYAEAADEFFKNAHLDSAELTAELMDRYKKDFKEKRRQLLFKIGEAYRHTPA